MTNPNTPQQPNAELTTVDWFKLAHSTAKDILNDTHSRIVQAIIAAAIGAGIGSCIAFILLVGLDTLCKRL